MSRSRKSAKTVFTGSQPDFVSVTLTPEDKVRIKATTIVLETFDETLLAMCHDGYKFSLRFDQFNDCYACFMTKPDDKDKRNQILTGRGSTPLKAIRQALYIHTVLLETNWPEVDSARREPLDD